MVVVELARYFKIQNILPGCQAAASVKDTRLEVQQSQKAIYGY